MSDDLRVRFEKSKDKVDGKHYYIAKFGLSDAEILLAVLIAALHVRTKNKQES